MSWIKNKSKIISINILILFIGLFAVEVYWRIYLASDITLTLNVSKNVTLLHEPHNMYETNKPFVTYSRNMYGLRTKHLVPNEIDVLVVGGSTTDQRYIDDQEEWVAIFEAQSGLKSANAGVDGQSTYGHLKNFEQWFSKIPKLNPKYIVFYVGVNDFYKDANFNYDIMQANEIKKDFNYYFDTSHLRFLQNLFLGVYQAQKANVGHGAMSLDKLELTSTGLIDKSRYQSLMDKRLKDYKSRLMSLAFKSDSMGAIPVFVTQSTIEEAIFNKKAKAPSFVQDYDSYQINGIDRVIMRSILNATTMTICDDFVGAVCVNLAEELKFDVVDFYDTVHNTPAGAEKIGKYLATKLN